MEHTFPSSQPMLLLEWTHPVRGLQLSSVHPLLSLQATTDPGAQVPSAQVSPLVHVLPSSQLAVFREYWQPSVVLQVSFVQVLLSSQAKVVLPEQEFLSAEFRV